MRLTFVVSREIMRGNSSAPSAEYMDDVKRSLMLSMVMMLMNVMNIGQENSFESLQLSYQPVGNAIVSIVLWYTCTLYLLYCESLPEFSSTFRLRE